MITRYSKNVIQGSGVPDIYKAWRDSDLDEPITDEKFGSDGTADLTVLTLPLGPRSIVSHVSAPGAIKGAIKGAKKGANA